MRTGKLLPAVVFLLAALLVAGGAAVAEETKTERRLLRASDGLQMPGSEADSEWLFVSYPEEDEVPTARMADLTGCSAGMTRSDFDATFERLSTVEPWMDRGQKKSARGFGKLGRIFHREYGDDLAAYRCETGGPEVPIYFVGANADGLSGLRTVNIET